MDKKTLPTPVVPGDFAAGERTEPVNTGGGTPPGGFAVVGLRAEAVAAVRPTAAPQTPGEATAR